MLIKSNRRGAASVEFAIAFPVLLMVVFGSVEFSRIAMLRHTANHAAHIAARRAIIPGATSQDVIAAGEKHLQSIGVKGAVINVSPDNITLDTKAVEVTVNFPVSENSLVVPEFVSGHVIGTCAMVTERTKEVRLELPPPPPPPATGSSPSTGSTQPSNPAPNPTPAPPTREL